MQEKFEVNGFPINDCVTGTVPPAGGSNKHLSSSFLLWLAYLSTQPVQFIRVESSLSLRVVSRQKPLWRHYIESNFGLNGWLLDCL